MQRSSALFTARVAAANSLLRKPTATPVSFKDTTAEYNANGLDVSSTSTKEFLKLQGALIPYRIVQLNDELKAVKEIGIGASLPSRCELMKKLAIMFLFYFAGRVYGRGSIVGFQRPPLTEEEIAEENKKEAAKQERLTAALAVAEEKRLARLEKEKAKEEKKKVALEAAMAAAEERRLQKALSRERGY